MTLAPSPITTAGPAPEPTVSTLLTHPELDTLTLVLDFVEEAGFGFGLDKDLILARLRTRFHAFQDSLL